jgi:hypothetical protein
MQASRVLAGVTAAFLSGIATAAPSEGVEEHGRHGLFVDSGVGAFFAAGGTGGYAQFRPLVELGAGYAVAPNENFLVPVSLHFSWGSIADNCFQPLSPPTGRFFMAGVTECAGSPSFTLLTFDASVGLLYLLGERFYAGGKLLGGFTALDPPPFQDENHRGVGGGLNLGVAASVEYFTALTHFSLGCDVALRAILGGPTVIQTWTFLPRFKYTF